MVKIVLCDGSRVFINPIWVEGICELNTAADGIVTRVYIHQATFHSSLDTREPPDKLAERLFALRLT